MPNHVQVFALKIVLAISQPGDNNRYVSYNALFNRDTRGI